MARTLRRLWLALVCLFATTAFAAPARPLLVVLISIDQFRADYLSRFADLYRPAEGKGGWAGSAT